MFTILIILAGIGAVVVIQWLPIVAFAGLIFGMRVLDWLTTGEGIEK